MTPEYAKAVLAELHRRSGTDLLTGLFPQQLAFIQAKSKFRAALCTRRAGKTYAVAVLLLLTMLAHPNSNAVYITITRRQAKKNLWPILKMLIQKHNLQVTTNETDLEVRISNGSTIMLIGCDDSRQIDKLRGTPYRLAVVDEAASFGAKLKELIEDAIGPALMDNTGDLLLMGTPGAACVGLFHEITNCNTKGWDVHKWSVLDNPFIPHAKAWIAAHKESMGWADNNPTYLREYCGRWVRDESSLVYKFTKNNVIQVLPENLTHHILGVDLGFDDATALSDISFGDIEPKVYIHNSFKQSHCIVSDVAALIKARCDKVKYERIIIDQGGLGKMIVAELNSRWQLPLTAAEKSDKAGIIALLNSDLQVGRVNVVQNDLWIEEAEILQWDIAHRKENSAYANHVCDAVLYGYREARHWLNKGATVNPLANSSEALAQWEKDYEKSLVKKIKIQYTRSWDNPDNLFNS